MKFSFKLRSAGFFLCLHLCGLIALFWPASSLAAVGPTDTWLNFYGLQRWGVVLDYDADGAATEEEFAFGTDPLNPASYPPRMSVSADGASFEIPVVAGVSFGSALLLTSTNLLDWETVPGFPPASPGVFTIAGNLDERVRFFTIGAPSLLNSDGDCLLDFEELNLFHTDPFKTDTDGDGIDDCTEVNVFHTDPNVASITGRGAIAGRVVLDEDKDPATQTHPGIQGWRVFLDLDYDSEFDLGEPNAVSQADGTYLIRELDPGFYRVRIEPRVAWLQVFPVLTPTPIPDGYPDRVVEVFDSGAGPIPFPYGRYPDPLPGLRLVFPSPPPDPVDASVVLGVLPASPIAGPYGGWAHVDMLAIPSNSFVTVAFDGEEIFDGPGPDLTIWTAADGPDETVEMYLGATASNLVSAGVIAQNASIPVDLADVGIKTPVRYVKLLGQGLLGTYPGFDLVGFEALHYRPLNRGHYDVEVQGGLTTGDLNFGVAGDDRPPKVMISTDQTDVRAGESLTAQVTASDDLGVASVQLNANGIAVPLSAQFQGTFTVQSGGLLTLAATATDTANQQGSTLLTLIARNEDGSLPDLSGLGISGGDGGTGGPSIQLVSPVSGEILAAPHNVIGSIIGSTAAVASWRLEYAPADLVNPEALDAPDADYILLAEGSGQAIGSSLGTLQGDTMPAGAYLLRVSASDINGTTRYFGFVFGVRIDPLDLRPEVVLTTPTNEATLTYSAAIQGSITTRQALREWYVEYAPLSQVNLNHISDNKPAWTRIGSGTEAVTNDILATFDTTLISDDSYVIRVSAWNKNGQGWAEPVLVHVAGGAKLGNFAVEFTDLSLPLAGIPVVIKRVYNSLTAQRPADFGYGWSLAVQNADIAETVPQTGTGLGSTPFRVGARVYLTAPDGKRVGFTFEPEIGAASFLGAAYKAVFKPDPGVVYKLSVPEGDAPFLSLNSNGELALFFVPLPWNPDRYVLTDTDGTSYTYDQFDGLIEAEDLNGNRVSFTDQAITHSAGPELRFTRDGAGRITAITAPDGQVWQYAYSTNGDLVAVTYPGNLSGTFGYSSERPHFLETIADPVRGPTLRTEYDDAGRVTAIIDAAGNRTSQEWDVGSFTGTFIDARGNVTKLTYDSRGNLTRREDPLGGVTTWEYKDASNPSVPTALVTPNGHRTTFVYSTAGTLLERRTPIARTFHTYDEDHNLTRTQYGTGGSETYRRDAMGNLLHIDSQHGDLSFTYTGSGLLASVLDGEGGLTRLEYEGGLSVPSRLVLPDGTVKQFTYDSYGRIVEYTDPAGGVQRYEYDASGRLTRTVDSNGAQQQTTYDAAFPHQPATVTDGAGRVTRYTYDNLGRLATETGPGGGVTRYEYNADGHRTAVVDPLNNRYEFSYDALGRLVEETDPLGNKRTHQYDLEGNRIVTVDRNARKRGFTYDAHNRMKTEEWIEPMGTGVVRTIRYDYDRIDQLTKVTDEGAILQFGTMYVPDGPLTSETMQYPGGTERRVAYVLDSAGRREGVQLTTTSPVLEPALSINYVRDLAGRLRILENRHPLPPTKVTDSAFQMQFWRNARGDIEELRRFTDQTGQNRVSQTFLNYSDPCACRLDSIEHIIATNQPMAEAAMAFVRSAGDRLNQIQDGTNTLTFDYDPAGQLIGASRNGATIESYSYDVNGNRLSSHQHGAYATGPGNRLVQAGPWVLTYDGEGNLLTKSNSATGLYFSFTWDHRNRLVAVQRYDALQAPPSLATEYRYDALDRRIAVIQNGQTNWTYYDGAQPLADFVNEESTPSAIYFSGEKLDELYAVWRRGAGLFFLLTDHLGTPRWILDRAGAEVGAFNYDSYGNLLSTSGTNAAVPGRFAFAGREWDDGAGLYYNRARYYDPELGRFIQEDPMGFAAGDPNLYRYVFNQPLTFTDPTGKVTAIEYVALASAMSRPGTFCRFAVCVNRLWSGVAQSVISLVPQGAPNGACAAGLGGVPASPFGAALAGGGAIWTGLTHTPGKLPNPAFGQLGNLGVCAYEASQ